MKIYIDFDGTIFDTSRFYNDFINICKSYGVDIEDVKMLRSNIKHLLNLDELAKIIKDKYELDDEYLDKVDSLYNSSYLYDDAIKFLDDNYKKNDLYLLTYGDNDYQAKKIKACNIDKYFKDIIISIDKSLENIDYQNSMFIDNNIGEIQKLQLVGATNLIRIKHDDDPYSKEESIDGVKEFFALSDIDVL